MTTLVLKALIAMTIALLLVVALRKARASVRHLVLAALFGFLLLLPVAERFAPRWEIETKSHMVTNAERAATGPIVATAKAAARTEARPAFTVTWFHAYATGVTLLLAWLALGVIRLRRLEADAEVWLEGTARMNEVANEANIRRPALVVISRDVNVPMTFGFRRSTIVLPAIAKLWPDAELTLALRHELEHVRREDWFLQLVARTACALYWPVPLVWLAWRRFCLEAERACDDAVVRCAEPEVYAGQLVSLARSVRGLNAMPALGMAQRSRLGERVAAILDPAQRRGPHSRVATVATFAFAVALLVSIAPAHFVAAAVAEAVPQRSPLGEALVSVAGIGDLATVRQILDMGVDVNTLQDGDGTALIGAARGGQFEMVEYLLSRGADVNLACPGDGNPLIAASANGHPLVAKLLLDRGARIDEVVAGDENALITAARLGHTKVVELLINRGADVNARVFVLDSDDAPTWRTPLKVARRGGHTDIERMLLAAGAKD
jgi:beta-lactamase regulating signal transducer with metallopeptidase domain